MIAEIIQKELTENFPDIGDPAIGGKEMKTENYKNVFNSKKRKSGKNI